MVESTEDFMGMGDVFGAMEIDPPSIATITLTSAPSEILHSRILDMAINPSAPQVFQNSGLTCKVVLKSDVENLSHDNDLLLACDEGTLRPLRVARISNPSSLNRHLYIPQMTLGGLFPVAAAFLLRPTPLTLALSRGHLDVAEYLIEQGAAINMPEGILEGAGGKGSIYHQFLRWFPIHFVSLLSRDREHEGGAVRLLKILLARGASLTRR
ncbi:uncharacterized protein PG998_010542 [Apiospora kogelbergensis]|uniref:uncharacterized protein n=1 Tax=Apiospora kogelbergensis TaxID=1337665 RepID=UPI00312D95D1